MNIFGKLVLGTTLAGAFGLAQAADHFGGITWAERSNNIQKSSSVNAQLNRPDLDGVIKNSETWGARAGMLGNNARYYLTYDYTSDTRHRYKLRQQNLLGSYDALLPLGEHGTQVFGGISAGLVSLEQESHGFSHDRDVGLAGGVQVGLIQQLGPDVELEGGYRYLRTSADVRFNERGVGNAGRADLHSSEEFYVGLNYLF